MTRGVRADRVGEKLSPLAREDSTGGRPRLGEAPSPVLDAGAVTVTRGFGRVCRCDLRASRKRGRRAARASARSGCARRGSGDRAGVLADCGGCRSRRAALGPVRKVMGLALWLPFAGAPGAKGRRKPGRGGESHEHASSDTGGGLLVIPRAERESGTRDRGREHSAMEGVLAQRRAAAFDEAAAARGTAIRGDGDAAFLAREGPDPRRIAKEGVRGTVASPDRGREHRGRSVQRGGAVDRGSTRTALRPSRGRSGHSPGRALGTPSGARAMVAAMTEAGALPSSKGSIRLAHRERGQRGRPRISCRSAKAQGESALLRCDPPQGGERRGGAVGNTAVRRVLVTGVGCRSR